jgi:hypothetical protein
LVISGKKALSFMLLYIQVNYNLKDKWAVLRIVELWIDVLRSNQPESNHAPINA